MLPVLVCALECKPCSGGGWCFAQGKPPSPLSPAAPGNLLHVGSVPALASSHGLGVPRGTVASPALAWLLLVTSKRAKGGGRRCWRSATGPFPAGTLQSQGPCPAPCLCAQPVLGAAQGVPKLWIRPDPLPRGFGARRAQVWAKSGKAQPQSAEPWLFEINAFSGHGSPGCSLTPCTGREAVTSRRIQGGCAEIRYLPLCQTMLLFSFAGLVFQRR